MIQLISDLRAGRLLSSTNKTDCHVILVTEVWLNVMLTTHNQYNHPIELLKARGSEGDNQYNHPIELLKARVPEGDNQYNHPIELLKARVPEGDR